MKLALIVASIGGATLALASVGYVDGIVHRDELLALIGALAAGAYLWAKLDNL